MLNATATKTTDANPPEEIYTATSDPSDTQSAAQTAAEREAIDAAAQAAYNSPMLAAQNAEPLAFSAALALTLPIPALQSRPNLGTTVAMNSAVQNAATTDLEIFGKHRKWRLFEWNNSPEDIGTKS